MQRGAIEFERVTKVYPGAAAPAVHELSMRIEPGETCALVGPSGSGKTTALRMVNRMIEPTSGAIRIDGADTRAANVEQLRRSIGYVIQQGGLFPHRTVLDNVATVPRLLGWEEHRIRSRCLELLELVGLAPDAYASRYPTQLSGGQRQRVGVARALAADPPVLLMDEPFGAIDPVVREQIQDEFLRMQREVRKTILIVTHDLDEAMRMGDRVAVLREGGILAQLSTPGELLRRPADEFVARFIGGGAPLRLLALARVAELPILPLDVAARHGHVLYVDAAGGPVHWHDGSAASGIALDATLRDALGELVAAGSGALAVVDQARRACGVVTRDQVEGWLRAAAPEQAIA